MLSKIWTIIKLVSSNLWTYLRPLIVSLANAEKNKLLDRAWVLVQQAETKYSTGDAKYKFVFDQLRVLYADAKALDLDNAIQAAVTKLTESK